MRKELLLLAKKASERCEKVKAFQKLVSYLDNSLFPDPDYFCWSIHIKEYPVHLSLTAEILNEECQFLEKKEYCIKNTGYIFQSLLKSSASNDFNDIVSIIRNESDLISYQVEINGETVDTIILGFERFKKRVLEI
jgi:hypothetical protein